MRLSQDGFRIVDIPPANQILLDSFENLPLDEFCGGKQRFHRFSQYKVSFSDDRWQLEPLPHRPLVQGTQYNNRSGGLKRDIPPVQVDCSKWVDAAFKSLELDTGRSWHFDINQYRVISTPDIKGISVPEGAHQDGHHYVLIFVFRRHAITGSVLSLLPLNGEPPLLQQVIEENQVIALDDTRMKHDASPIQPISEYGYRDYFGTALNPWEERRYGEAFESQTLAARTLELSE